MYWICEILFEDTTGGDLSDYLAVREETAAPSLAWIGMVQLGDARLPGIWSRAAGHHRPALDELQQQGNLLTHG